MDALRRLAELVQEAEEAARSGELRTELKPAVEGLRQTALEYDRAAAEFQAAQAEYQRLTAEAQAEEAELQELTKKLARLHAHLTSPHEAGPLVDAARSQIRIKGEQAQARLQPARQAHQDALAALEPALERYQKMRLEISKLAPELAAQCRETDSLAERLTPLFPLKDLAGLAAEIEWGDAAFGSWPRWVQYPQMKLWIGRLRRLQAAGLSEEQIRQTRDLFGRLVGLSKQYEPGYIEAFRHEYQTDWELFIAEARRQLEQARTETSDMHAPPPVHGGMKFRVGQRNGSSANS